MTTNRRFLLPLLLVLALGSTACVRPWGPTQLSHDLARTSGVKLDREFGITVGRSGVWLARKFVDEDDFSLRGVRKVQVAVYQVEGYRKGFDGTERLRMPDLPEWTPLVRVHDDGESAFVLIREDDERIRGLLVVAADDDEWVVVKLRGNLDRVLEEAMRMAFDEADSPDLYEKSRAERGLPESSALSPDPSG